MFKKALLIALASGLCTLPGLAAAIELNFQGPFPEGQAQSTAVLIPWAQSFAQKSDGKFVVHFFGAGAIVKASEAEHAVSTGMLDMAGWGPVGFPKSYPYMTMSSLPFLAKNSLHAARLFNAMYQTMPEVKRELDKQGIPLAIWSSASMVAGSTKAAITSPADFAGKRVIIPNPALSTTVEAWGGIPVYTQASDVYVGLQRGMGDIFYGGAIFVKSLKLIEVVRHVTVLPTSYNCAVISINKSVFHSMTPEEQKLLKDNSADLAEKLMQSHAAEETQVLESCKAQGIEVHQLTDAQSQAFREAIAPVIQSYWLKSFEQTGVKNAPAEVEKLRALAATIPAD